MNTRIKFLSLLLALVMLFVSCGAVVEWPTEVQTEITTEEIEVTTEKQTETPTEKPTEEPTEETTEKVPEETLEPVPEDQIFPRKQFSPALRAYRNVYPDRGGLRKRYRSSPRLP